MQRSVFPDERLWELEDRYRGSFEVEPLSYGTVRDLADSRDHFAGLARATGDMKDLQRCWMVKAVLGSVERGGRLVEIGAGEPLVADLLTRLGHEVTVVDPYDGSGNGPLEFERFRGAYPDVELHPRALPAVRGAARSEVACVYSISVLEHIPHRASRRGRRRRAGRAGARAAARSTRSTTCRRLGRRGAPGAPRGDRPALGSLRGRARIARSSGCATTPTPTSSRPRRTSAGAAPFPTTTTRCGASPRSACSAARDRDRCRYVPREMIAFGCPITDHALYRGLRRARHQARRRARLRDPRARLRRPRRRLDLPQLQPADRGGGQARGPRGPGARPPGRRDRRSRFCREGARRPARPRRRDPRLRRRDRGAQHRLVGRLGDPRLLLPPLRGVRRRRDPRLDLQLDGGAARGADRARST